MRSRIFFFGVTAFWLVMNILFYRSERGGHGGFAASVPVETVWQKILTAPDNSSLDIYDHDKKIGFGRWAAGTAEAPLIGSKVLSPDYTPGSPAAKPTGYGLSFDGSAHLNASNHLRFQTSLSLDTNKLWKEFRLRATLRPDTWELLATAANQTVTFNANEDGGVWNKTWKFSDLQNPQNWLGDFVDTSALGFAGLSTNLLSVNSATMQWEAHEDRMKFSESEVPVYRLDSDILGQHIEVVVSRIGEILRVELPFHISLRNEAVSPDKD